MNVLHALPIKRPPSTWMKALTITLALACPVAIAQADTQANAPDNSQARTLLIGTYTDGYLYLPTNTRRDPSHSKGIYRVRMDAEGKLTRQAATPVVSPSWLVVDPQGHYVYAVNEATGHTEGQVSALMVDPDSGELHLINQQPSHGWQPTHAALSPDGRYLLVANYSVDPGHAGVSVFPIEDNGSLGEMVQNIPHLKGSGGVPDRQASGHAHSVTFSPDGKKVFVADLGADKLSAYRYQPDSAQPLSADDDATIEFPKGSGPRHMLFDESGKHAYLVTEMGAHVYMYDYRQGRLEQRQALALTDKQDPNAKAGSGLGLSPDGQFLYVGNRGTTNELVAYRVNADDGTLSEVGHYSSQGKEPRAFRVGADFVLVANQFSDQVVEFKRDAQSGALTPTGEVLDIESPSDVKALQTTE